MPHSGKGETIFDLFDFFELGDLWLSWRLFVGIAVTCGACWFLFHAIPDESVAWGVCVPLGLLGVVLSFRWQTRADRGDTAEP